MALFKRKDKDGKRKGENAIGKIIYGFLLFMPLFAVGIACLYTVFNKNAYQSYDSTLNSTYTKLSVNDQLQPNHDYYLTPYYGFTQNPQSQTIYFYDYINVTLPVYTGVTADGLSIVYQNGTSARFYYYNSTNPTTSVGSSAWFNPANEYTNIIITLTSFTKNGGTALGFNVNTYINTKNTLDNAFYYQLEKLEQSDLFNWTKNTGAYTVMHNVTEGIGITNTYTPMLMTYWLLISVIYFIFDIALILVWAVHDKIHELKDAI